MLGKYTGWRYLAILFSLIKCNTLGVDCIFLKLSAINSENTAHPNQSQNITGLLIVKDTGCINVWEGKGWLTASWEVWRDYFYLWCFQHVASVSDVQKYITVPESLQSQVVIIQRSRCETLKTGHSSVLPLTLRFSPSLSFSTPI